LAQYDTSIKLKYRIVPTYVKLLPRGNIPGCDRVVHNDNNGLWVGLFYIHYVIR